MRTPRSRRLSRPAHSTTLCLAILSAGATSALAQLPPPLVYYDFEEGAGATVSDGSLNGHDGSIVNNVSFVAGAPAGSTPAFAGRFSEGGVAGYVNVPGIDVPSMVSHRDSNPDGSYTLACWLRPDALSLTGDRFIWGQTSQGIHNGLRGSGTLHTAHWGSDFNAATPLTAGDWVHATWTYDGASDQANIYLNGVLDGGPFAQLGPNGSGNLIIGGRNGGTQNFVGDLDEMAIWTEVLDETNIQLLAEGESPIGATQEDVDEDGLPDGYELALRGNLTDLDGTASGPGPGAGTGDFDGDGVADLAEFEGTPRTSPVLADTDGDDLDDGVETNTGIWNGISDTGTNPARTDSDNDGLADNVENPELPFVDINQPGTDPNKFDTDGDGFGDFQEINNGSDPTRANSTPNLPINLGIGTAALLNNDATFPLRDLTDPENDGDPEADSGYNAVFDSSEEMGFAGGEFAYNVFDNVVGGGNDKWCCGNSGFPYWVQATWETPYVLTNFTVASANDTPGRDPTVWEIQGSNDGVTFDTIFRQDDPSQQVWGPRLEVLRWDAGVHYPMPPAYTTIRFVCEATMLTSGAMYQVAELEFFGTEGGDLFQITSIIPSPNLTLVDLEFSSFEGRVYAIEFSRDLAQWIEIDDGVQGQADITEFTHVGPPNDGNPVFYRVKQVQ